MLYLMGDAFYRWDGFRYYASFYEFIPSLALITVLWSILSVITAILIWMVLTAVELICLRIRLEIKIENMLVFFGFLISFSMLAMAGFLLNLLTAVFVTLFTFLWIAPRWGLDLAVFPDWAR